MIGDRIKELREQYGMTQTALAKKLGLSRSAINAWEMGISIPSTQYVGELAMLFRVSSDFLLELHRTESIDVTGLNRDEKAMLYGMLDYIHRHHHALELLDGESQSTAAP